MSENGTATDDVRQIKCINYAIDICLGSEYRSTVVERALNWRKKASPEAKKLLRSAITSSNFEIQGFRSASAHNAPSGRLVDPIVGRMPFSNRLSTAILKTWVESHDRLYAEAVEYHEKYDLPIEKQSLDEQFRNTWQIDQWERETEAFVNIYDKNRREDAALMLCYVSGSMPLPPLSDLDQDESSMEGSRLPMWVNHLQALPPEASEWEHIAEFVDEVRQISQSKEKEALRVRSARLEGDISGIREDYASELTYLERDTNAWSADNFPTIAEISAAVQRVGQFSELLAEYRPLREQATTRSEEDDRRRRRLEMEPRVLEFMDELNEFMLRAPSEVDDSLPAEAASVEPEQDDSLEPAGSAGDAAHADPSVDAAYASLQAEQASLSEQCRKFEQRIESLQADKQSLHQRIKDQRVALNESRRDADYWRTQFIDARKLLPGGVQSTDDEEEKMRDVKDVIERATAAFHRELLIQPNSRSDKAPRFRDAQSVWDALAWLATDYYKSRCGQASEIDLDYSLREACGWWYKPNQSDTAMNKYRDYYTTKVNGKTYLLDKHIGKGSSKDPRYTIRIGFAWDKERQVVVIGYIGQHQKTDAT